MFWVSIVGGSDIKFIFWPGLFVQFNQSAQPSSVSVYSEIVDYFRIFRREAISHFSVASLIFIVGDN